MKNRAAWFLCVVVPFLIVATQRPAEAGSYSISGKFGDDISGTTGLAGGSFSGTFAATGLPVNGGAVELDSFDVNFYTAGGTLFGTLSSLDLGQSDGLVRTLTLPGIGVVDNLAMEDYAALNGQGLGFSLNFASPFDGVGDVIPFNPPGARFSSLAATDIADFPFNSVAVISGASVPEPSSLLLGILGTLGCLAFARLCRATTS